MKHKMLLAAVGTGALGLLAGCAKTTPVESAPAPDRSMSAGEGARWTANIQSVTQSRGDVAQSTRDRSYGSATWTVGETAVLSKADVVFTYAGQEKYLSWSILPGNCGTGSIPVLSTANFPEINIAGGGRGQVSVSLPIQLPTGGAYHIDIYRDRRQGTESLVGCGNMRYSGR